VDYNDQPSPQDILECRAAAHAPVADALVVVFTYGISLRTWQQTGGIMRELALYTHLANHYGTIILCTYGGAEDREILHKELPEEVSKSFQIVSNEERVDTATYAQRLPALVRRALGPSKRVVVKTNQMAGGHIAARIVQHLRSWGLTTALVARGGYLWSRMSAYEHGPSSKQACDAAAIESELCANADMVVGTTSEMLEDLQWRYMIQRDRTRLIPNYVLVDEEAPERERLPGLLLYAGQLVKRKRVDVLIDAVAELDPELRSQLTLEIIGDGPELESLAAQAAQRNAPVVFRGRLPHAALLERMKECALYLQASEMEGHPKTVLEAMGCGAPVIVASSPGLAQVVQHGVTGLRIQLTSDSFARAITELMADSDWRSIMSTGGIRCVRSSLSLDDIVPKELESHRAAMVITQATPRLKMSM
jgi:glycosyltransferase involved in cell wall biosynthesis